MWIGNLMLEFLNLPLIGLWVNLLKAPYRILFPAILVFCTIGVYSLNCNIFDIFITAIFGVIGYIWSKLKCEGAPLLLGWVVAVMSRIATGSATVAMTTRSMAFCVP